MNKSETTYTCLVDGSKLTEIIDLGLHAFADTFVSKHQLEMLEPIFPLVCMLCEKCGLVQLKYITRDFDRYNLYEYSYTSSNSNFSRSHWNGFAAEALERTERRIQLVVEIGSNDGYLLQQFKPHVGRVIGVDSSEEMARIANTQDIETLHTSFDLNCSNQIKKKFGPADLVVANNVLNHSNDPVDFIDGVNNLLVDDGVFIFEVPYWRDTVASLHFDQIYHEHVTYFTVRSVEALTNKCGMRIQELQIVDYHGGSLRVTATKNQAHGQSSNLVQLIIEEEELGLFDPQMYSDYFVRIKEKRSQFLLKMHEFICENPYVKIAGVGAAAKANTLLTFYGLNHSYIDYLTDASTHKIGKYTPFTRIPIFSDNEFSNHSDVAAIVLSWNIGETLRRSVLSINQNVRFLEL